MIFGSLSAFERLVARVVVVEVVIVTGVVIVVGLSRLFNIRFDRDTSNAATGLTTWFSNQLLGEASAPPLALLAKLPARRARLLLAEQSERVVPEERAPLRELYIQLGLHKRSKSPQLWEKLVAIRDARAFGDPAHDVQSYVEDENADVRLAAFEALVDLGRVEEALPAVPAAASGSTSSRLRVIDALSKRPVPVNRLVALARGPSNEGRQVAVALLGRTNVPEAMEELVHALDDSDREVRIQALRAIRATGNPSRVDACGPLVKDPEWEVRSEAVRTLAALGGERFAGPISGLLEDSAEWVRHHAARALLMCGPEGMSLLTHAASRGVAAAVTALAIRKSQEASP